MDHLSSCEWSASHASGIIGNGFVSVSNLYIVFNCTVGCLYMSTSINYMRKKSELNYKFTETLLLVVLVAAVLVAVVLEAVVLVAKVLVA